MAKQAREIFDKASIDAPAQKVLAHVAGYLQSHNVRGYLVGGFVRDALLGRETTDIDIAVAADGLEIGPRLADSLQGKFVPLDEVNRIGRIIIPDWTIDVASFNGKIEDDLKRRDFTINAMAVDLRQLISENQNAVLIDPYRRAARFRPGNNQNGDRNGVPGRPGALIEGTKAGGRA